MKQLRIVQQVTNRESASLDKYLNEISKFRLLTPDQEVILARKIRKGDRKALETLVNANLRFVVSVAKQHQCPGMQLADLINEGNLGLIKAAERFDETKGFKFISYAVWWIRQSILQSTSELSRLVKLPSNMVLSFNQVNKAFARLEQDYQREPTAYEIAEITSMHPDVIDGTLTSTHYHLSLDAPLKGDETGEGSLYDLISENDIPRPDELLIHKSLKNVVDRTLATLEHREAKIIRYFFGLNGIEAHSLEEIGHEMNLTRERVRQLKEKAITRLQKLPHNRLLKAAYVA
jgi:RNA polymerase primary sigma factor